MGAVIDVLALNGTVGAVTVTGGGKTKASFTLGTFVFTVTGFTVSGAVLALLVSLLEESLITDFTFISLGTVLATSSTFSALVFRSFEVTTLSTVGTEISISFSQ